MGIQSYSMEGSEARTMFKAALQYTRVRNDEGGVGLIAIGCWGALGGVMSNELSPPLSNADARGSYGFANWNQQKRLMETNEKWLLTEWFWIYLLQ